MERILLNWENKVNSLNWPWEMNMIQITGANLKQVSLFKSLLRLPWLKKINHLVLTVGGVFCFVHPLISSLMVLWTLFPHSSWPKTSLFCNCDSLSKISKLMGLETNNEEQRELWQRFLPCSSCSVFCYCLPVRWLQRHHKTLGGCPSCPVPHAFWPTAGDSLCAALCGSCSSPGAYWQSWLF